MNMQLYQGIIGGNHRANVAVRRDWFGKISQKKETIKKKLKF
jgi:hypothetical protein